MRAQKSGIILNLSSVGGFKSFAYSGVYCATKFALEGLTEALNLEIEPFGLKAVIVEPGYFRTELLASGRGQANMAPSIAAYDGTVAHEARDAALQYDGKQPGNPVEGAARIWEYVSNEGLLKGKKKLLRLTLGTDCGAILKQQIADLQETLDVYDDVWKSTDFPRGQ
jgi:NAD(P)-dependent dehydrogenase (short-subunit alcohol dehydrogenase family)